MKRLLIILSLLVLVPIPSLAYYDLASATLEPSFTSVDTHVMGGITNFDLTVADFQGWAGNVTHMEFTGTGYRAGNKTGSATSRMYTPGPGYFGYGTVSWDWSATGTYSGKWTIIIDIINATSPDSKQGLAGVSFVDVPWLTTLSYRYNDIWTGLDTPYSATPASKMWNGTYLIQGGSAIPPASPNGDYACNLFGGVFQPSPFDLQCWPDEAIYPAADNWSWTLTQPDASDYASTNETLVKTLTQYGWYGLDYRVCNSVGCGYSNTTELVNLTAEYHPTGINFRVNTVDPITGSLVHGSELGIYNATAGSWRNLTLSGGSAYIDSSLSLPGVALITAGQTLNITGTASGYSEGPLTAITIPYSGWEYNYNLVRSDLVPFGTNSTMIVNVINTYTAESLAGVTLTVSNSTIPYSSSKLSNDGGSAVFTGLQAGSYQITASKTGYTSSTKNWPTAAGEVSNAYISLLPIGATPIVTSTGGDPIYDDDGNPIIGYDLSGNPITASPTQDYRTNDEKAEGMMDIFYDNGEGLIMLFILFTIMYMLKGIVW